MDLFPLSFFEKRLKSTIWAVRQLKQYCCLSIPSIYFANFIGLIIDLY